MTNRPIIEFLHPETLEFICGCGDYTSLTWENCTCGYGSIELHIPRAELRISHGIVIRLCRDVLEPYGVVTAVRLTPEETVVYASTLSRVFDWRYMQNNGPEITLSTGEGVGKLICLCGKYGLAGDNDNDFFGKPALLEYPSEDLSVSVDTSFCTSCLELMTWVAREANYGFGCTVEDGQLKLFAYPYTDKGHTLSTADMLVGDLEYFSSCDSHRNVFGYSLGSDEEGYTYRAYPQNSTASGIGRRVINLGSFSQIPNGLLREKEALLTETESVSATIRLPYPDAFSLGEIITVVNPAWDFSKKLAVTRVTQVWEQSCSCRVTFGIPPETVYRKLLRIYR